MPCGHWRPADLGTRTWIGFFLATVAENGGLLSSILFHGTAEIASDDVMTWEVQQLAGAPPTRATIAPDGESDGKKREGEDDAVQDRKDGIGRNEQPRG